MDDGFLMSATGLRGSGDRIQQVGGRFGTDAQPARGELNGSSAVWGADEVGNAFGGAYLPIAQLIGESIDAITQGFQAISANLHAMSDHLDAAEADSAAASARVSNHLAT